MKDKLRKSLIGRKANLLTVIEEIFHPSNPKLHLVKCRCDCGNEKLIRRLGFKFSAKSCGCLQKKAILITSLNNRTFGKAALSRQYYNHVHNATIRNIIPLSKEKWNNIVLLPCYFCGEIDVRDVMRSHKKGVSKFQSEYTEEEKLKYVIAINGVDRLDNNLGYVDGNCVPCCGWCNTMKRNYTEKNFLEKITKIYNFQKNKSL
jgi:hypothetical protein